MILRKPYAFFIKQFKTIHFILSLLIAFLIYQTTLMVAFFNEYLNSSTLTVDPTAIDKLFNSFVFAAPVLIIIASVLVLSILFIKKKPFLFYIVNVGIYIAVITIFNNALTIVESLTQRVVDLQTLRLIRDLLLISIFLQLFTVIKTFVYATGFDIKKFNFGQDLAELEIEETDNEEFEFEISVDTNKARRNLRRNLRFAKYVYIENRFLINMGLLLLTGLTILVIYFNQNIYNKAYNEKAAFLTKDFTMRINRSFITKENPQGREVSRKNMSFVIVEVELKKNGVQKIKLDVARAQLVVNNKIYYHQFGLNDLVPDIGFIYNDDQIPDEFTRYLLIYEVPDEYIKNKNLQFKFLDTFGFSNSGWHPKYVRVNIAPIKLDKIVKTTSYNLGETISFENSVLGKTTFKINDFKIARQHKLEYNFCVNNNECYDSYEYVKPDIYNVTDKTIMYLNGLIDWDNDLAILPIVDLYQFMNNFATVHYEINGQSKQQTFGLKEVKTQRVKRFNDYYVEVAREIEQADKITISFNIRDMQYTYRLR